MASSLKPSGFDASCLKRKRGKSNSAVRLASSFKLCKADGGRSTRSRSMASRFAVKEELLVRPPVPVPEPVYPDLRFEFLPEELLEEILARLPVRSIARFRSVCKAWRSLLHSRSFVDRFRSRIPPPILALLSTVKPHTSIGTYAFLKIYEPVLGKL